MGELKLNLYTILLIATVTVVILIIVQVTSRRLYSYIDDIQGVRKDRRKQTITFLQIITWSISVIAVCVGILMILSEFGVDITPLLASVGIAGLALGSTWTADRPYLIRLSPPKYLGEFYGLFRMAGRFASIIGPLLWGFITDTLGLGRPIALSVLLLFIIISFVILQGVQDHQREWPAELAMNDDD